MNIKLSREEILANRTKWLEALESGKYRQANATLRALDKEGNASFCCLGLACDLLIPGEWKPKTGKEPQWDAFYGEDGTKVDLFGAADTSWRKPDGLDVRKALGMSAKSAEDCAAWNDEEKYRPGERLTFPEIAAKMRGRWRMPK